ncbi:MAG: phage holin family protein [Clostridia bacterium]|nr:phage holin family protein [Clostridia bacterium]
MSYQEYIKPELLVLIPVLYLIGAGLKRSATPNKLIPLLIGIASITLTTAWVFATSNIFCFKDVAMALFVSVTQGVLCAGESVYINQLYVQSKKNE